MGSNDKVQGEGDYEAARNYRRKLEDHVENHDVDKEARDAAPKNADEAAEMKHAEAAGKSQAKELDPALKGHGESRKGAKSGEAS